MNKQRGVSLSGLMVVVVVVIFVALLGLKVAPSIIEYNQIKHAISATAEDGSLKNGSVADVRRAYSRRQELENIKKIGPQDLDITKDGNDLVLSFAYQEKIPLFKNVSLVIDFEATTAGK